MEAKHIELDSEKKKRKNNFRKGLFLFLFSLILFIAGIGVGYFVPRFVTIKDYTENTKFDEIYGYLNNYWLYGDDYEDLESVAYNMAYYGMTSFEDDPYTTYMSVDDSDTFSSNLNKQQYGVGIGYIQSNGVFFVSTVYAGSGADKAGIKKGDIIVSIDEESVDGKTSEELKEMVLGSENTYVKVGVLRNDSNLEFDVMRSDYNSSASAYLQGDVVVLNIYSFGDETPDLISNYLSNYTDKSKLVIDLRDNPGGYLGSLQSLLGLFIGNNQLCMQAETKDGNISKYYTTASVTYSNFTNIAILINGNTASASEVFTIAMKECHENVTIIGTNSYGKGVMQSTFPLSDGNYIKITTAKWYSPSGVSIHKVGITPDIEVKDADAISSTYYEYDEEDTFKVDSVSVYTKLAQVGLEYLGYTIDRKDGYMSSDTLKVINDYQKANNLEITDCLDYDTYMSLFKDILYTYYTDNSKDNQLTKALNLLKN